ncbi:MAG: hypothetical protein IKR73_04960 [Oscillospiraceae bacterium]|nr:hypothetical protein [Oscillospiraceae bacterium]
MNTEGSYSTDPLSFTIDGVTFKGTSLTDLQPADDTDLAKACERFCILKEGGFTIGKDDDPVPYWYTLQRYAMVVDIPITVVRKRDKSEAPAMLHISFEYKEHDPERIQGLCYCDDERVYQDDIYVYAFDLSVDGKVYSGETMTLCFESALMDISRKISADYYLKCCFTCQYSDYSPYGNDDFGIMQCFLRQKENYLKVNSKIAYFTYLTDDWDSKQETQLCDKFEPRIRCDGYRGYVDGAFDM